MDDGHAPEERRTAGLDATQPLPDIPREGAIQPYLQALGGAETGRLVPLENRSWRLGRSPDNDLAFDIGDLSRRHARLLPAVSGQFSIEDLGSCNGTFVDGQRVESRTELRDGARILLGGQLLLKYFQLTSTEARRLRSLHTSAMRDHLTGTGNRRYFMERLETELAFSLRHHSALAVGMIDLDRFKEVNDVFGHLGGDQVLMEVANRLQASLRCEDLLARYGGEEFALLLRHTGPTQAATVGERIRLELAARPVKISSGRAVTVTVSIGIAALNRFDVPVDATQLLAQADRLLYSAKAAGRDEVVAKPYGPQPPS